VVLAIITMAA